MYPSLRAKAARFGIISLLTATLSLSGSGRAAPYDPPGGYYNGTIGKSGAELEAVLHEIIDDHTVVAYSWPPFLDIDESVTNSAHIDLIYNDGTREKMRNGGAVGDWNREHLWPRSFGIFNDNGADNSDLFNLRPSDVQVNSERGSLVFDKTDPSGEISLQFSAPGCSKDSDSWEPRDDEKGDIARACFYMDVRYDGSDPVTNDLELSDVPNKATSHFGSRLTLLTWHRLDPPDERERQRNHAIYSNWQGNRNPFIDHPEFAEQIFLAAYPELDRDTDGLPDWWEYRTTGDLSATVDDDADGDGADTLLEFALASDPADATDRPSAEVAMAGGLTLSYKRSTEAANSGARIVVEQSEDLEASHWTPASIVDTEITPAGNGIEEVALRLSVPGGTGRHFFRIAVSASP